MGGFRPLLQVIRDQMHLGVEFVQIREKDLTARELFEFTLAVLEVRDIEIQLRSQTKILVNSRADIARATSADGVHLPSDAPEETLSGLLIIRSCHTLEEVQKTKAHLVVFGPVFPTPSKGPAVGLEQLRAACKLRAGVLALGGVTWENAADCTKAGADGIAGIRLFQEPGLYRQGVPLD